LIEAVNAPGIEEEPEFSEEKVLEVGGGDA
jgi:hypothetical protein